MPLFQETNPNRRYSKKLDFLSHSPLCFVTTESDRRAMYGFSGEDCGLVYSFDLVIYHLKKRKTAVHQTVQNQKEIGNVGAQKCELLILI